MEAQLAEPFAICCDPLLVHPGREEILAEVGAHGKAELLLGDWSRAVKELTCHVRRHQNIYQYVIGEAQFCDGRFKGR